MMDPTRDRKAKRRPMCKPGQGRSPQQTSRLRRQPAASERDAEDGPASADMVAPEAALRGESDGGGAAEPERNRALEDVDLPTGAGTGIRRPSPRTFGERNRRTGNA